MGSTTALLTSSQTAYGCATQVASSFQDLRRHASSSFVEPHDLMMVNAMPFALSWHVRCRMTLPCHRHHRPCQTLRSLGTAARPASSVDSNMFSHSAQVCSPDATCRVQVKHLGEGAFASVDECTLAGQRVAVKRLKPDLFSNDTELTNFVTEGVTIAKLSHPCVCSLLLRDPGLTAELHIMQRPERSGS